MVDNKWSLYSGYIIVVDIPYMEHMGMVCGTQITIVGFCDGVLE